MCGIVGYVGKERCVEVLMEGLRNLEYRGYDSAGLALQVADGIEPLKRVGPLKKLSEAVAESNGYFSRVKSGVGHTRWATHGKPSEVNAHPMVGGSGGVAVVHNGIIENHEELREDLESRGHVFDSETDTEVIAHLLAEKLENSGGLLRNALSASLELLQGSFAVAVVSDAEPNTIVAARHQSPLVVGIGDGENFLASAVQALLGETREFLFVENGEIVEITDENVEIFTLSGDRVEREPFEVDWDADAVELGGYKDFMLKEIHEQPAALGATLLGRIDVDGAVDLSELTLDLSDVDRIVVVACGTALHAGLLGKNAIEKYARIPVEVAVASEYRYSDPIGDEKTLVIAISQSGETSDTLAAVEAARGFGAKVLAITNTQGSLLTREADTVLLTKAGPEIAVASTKAFVTQVAVLNLLALELARVRETLSKDSREEIGRGLRLAPEKTEETLGMLEGRIEPAVSIFDDARCSLFLARGALYPVAMEGALKLKEISYLPSEGYPAGEMKHGPIALVDEQCPVVAVLGEGLAREKTLSNVEQTIARGANVILVARQDDPEADRIAQATLPVPRAPEILTPLVASVPLQLLAYHIAKSRGLNVDKPRNLAKSVTVE
ncbi:MAG: glutamine--fructose-6-phosphate transaminase (isomerizing) [Rubrobacteraceae bacterium]